MVFFLFLGLVCVGLRGTLPTAGADTHPATMHKTCRKISQLPPPVRKMYRALYRAARSGDLETFREVFQMNELPPVMVGERIDDPVSFLKSRSVDGSGHDMLARISLLLEVPCVMVQQDMAGAGKSRNSIPLYVWPKWRHTGLGKLKGFERVLLFRLVASPQKAASMLRRKKYDGPELGIGADGTWHFWRP